MSEIDYKHKAEAFEKALEGMEIQFARLKGLLGTMIFIFGEDVMKAVTDYYDDPTEENGTKIRDQLELHFMAVNNEQ